MKYGIFALFVIYKPVWVTLVSHIVRDNWETYIESIGIAMLILI